MVNTILAKRVNHIVAKGDNPAWPKGSKSRGFSNVYDNVRKKHVVLAPTGIAAINAGGSTLHSFFKLPFHPLLPDDPNLSLQKGRIHEFFKYTKTHRKLLEELELVIIDEISMVRADIIDAVDRILRVYSHNLREPSAASNCCSWAMSSSWSLW